VNTLSSTIFEAYETLRQELTMHPQAIQLRAQLRDHTASPGWTDIDGILMYQGPAVLDHAHTTGHEGSEKTLHHLREAFYSSHARRCVQDFVRSCAICQKNKIEYLHLAGLLQPLSIPSEVWSDIAMDFIEGFSKVGGKSVILTVVGRFSKYAYFIPLSHPYSASSVARAFFENIVRLHGVPCSIVSNRDPIFTSIFWKELFNQAGVKLLLSTMFHPQTDGQSKVVNHTIAMYLRCLAGNRPRSWLKWLPWAEFCYNSSYQTALRVTPFQVVYGCSPPSLLEYQGGSSRVQAVDEQLRERDEFLQQIKERLLLA
jgi:hypothetical protein